MSEKKDEKPKLNFHKFRPTHKEGEKEISLSPYDSSSDQLLDYKEKKESNTEEAAIERYKHEIKKQQLSDNIDSIIEKSLKEAHGKKSDKEDVPKFYHVKDETHAKKLTKELAKEVYRQAHGDDALKIADDTRILHYFDEVAKQSGLGGYRGVVQGLLNNKSYLRNEKIRQKLRDMSQTDEDLYDRIVNQQLVERKEDHDKIRERFNKHLKKHGKKTKKTMDVETIVYQLLPQVHGSGSVSEDHLQDSERQYEKMTENYKKAA